MIPNHAPDAILLKNFLDKCGNFLYIYFNVKYSVKVIYWCGKSPQSVSGSLSVVRRSFRAQAKRGIGSIYFAIPAIRCPGKNCADECALPPRSFAAGRLIQKNGARI